MSSTGPVDHRDIRSTSVAFKRDRDHNSKWSMGIRPSGVVPQSWFTGELAGGSDQRVKVRPMKQLSQMTSDHKSHHNKTPKASSLRISYSPAGVSGRTSRKVDAQIDASDHDFPPLSTSLLDLLEHLPPHTNNKSASVRIGQGSSSEGSAISGVLYSYDTKGDSPTGSGRSVDLGGLVEQAEKKWKSKETEKIVKSEYEVLDNQGKTTVLSKGMGKKGSPKHKISTVVADPIDEDDDFELI